MSGTYRTALVYVRDGYYDYGNKARNSAARLKKIDRRKARRDAAKVKRAAMREYEVDVLASYAELCELERDEARNDAAFWQEIERGIEEQEWRELDREYHEERYRREMEESEMFIDSYDYYPYDPMY